MSNLKILFFALFAFRNLEFLYSTRVRKFVYQKDMSEYCKRQVIPSVFLGRHVAASYSEILHFSQLEVPYSCFISIRAELASNIILVIQITTDERLNITCQERNEPLLVYDMGETFGGYWGPIPDSIVNVDQSTPAKYYTLATRRDPSEMENDVDEKSDSSEEEIKESYQAREYAKPTPVELQEEKDRIEYFTVEVPLMNVSGEMVKADGVPEPSFLQDEIFDIIYNVTPKPGHIYDTTVVPLVQFSVRRHYGDRREGNDTDEPRYDLDYNLGEYTPDDRLLFPQLTETHRKGNFSKGYRYSVNRRLTFKNKNPKLFVPKGSPPFRNKPTSTANPFNAFTRRFLDASAPSINTDVANKHSSNSWNDIDDLLKLLNNRRSDLYPEQERTSEQRNNSALLHKISNMNLNSSLYLLPNLSMYNVSDTKSEVSDITGLPKNGFLSSNSTSYYTAVSAHNLETFSTVNETNPAFHGSDNIKPGAADNSPRFVNKSNEQQNISFITAISTESTFGAKAATFLTSISPIENSTTITFNASSLNRTVSTRLVDHESWGNVVQSAPVIVGLLNKTTSVEGDPKSNKVSAIESGHQSVAKRKKRFIKAIAIDNARPNKLTTRPVVMTKSEPVYIFSDMHDFAKFVELPDDEMYGHVALNQMHRHVGNLLFNICDVYDPPTTETRHVFLFNTSRIIISINNFTLNSMTLVATPARVLTKPDAHCNNDHLECQVSGARVCIEATNACDGIPNCGAFDIYDEDRMRCGDSSGNHHNVYLAAFTFMIVLFTILYTVHYWLKRCIPKVSDAFFIYTDGSENILYLDSIMRSPTDTDEVPKLIYDGNLFNEDLIYPGVKENDNSCLSKLKQCFRFCFRKTSGKQVHASFDLDYLDSFHTSGQPTSMFSFPEFELSKLKRSVPVEVGVQTGDSLEMNFINESKKRNARKESDKTRMKYSTDALHSNRGKVEDLQEKSKDSELNLLKFLKDIKSASENWYDRSWDATATPDALTHDVASGEETELHSTVYGKVNSLDRFMYYDSDTQVDIDKPGPSNANAERKRLRFNEKLTTIPSAEDVEYESTMHHRDALGDQLMPLDIASIEENEEQSTGREFRFWGSNKGKKHHVKRGKQSTFR